MSEEQKRIRCGDTIRMLVEPHDTLICSYADYEADRVSWSGWPFGMLTLSEVELVESCSDEDHLVQVARWLDRPQPKGDGWDNRRSTIMQLYRPEQYRAENVATRAGQIASLEAQIERFWKAQEADGAARPVRVFRGRAELYSKTALNSEFWTLQDDDDAGNLSGDVTWLEGLEDHDVELRVIDHGRAKKEASDG